MAISRVPGFSLLANLDRQGTDVFISSNGQTLFYWDVNNYRIGVNTETPQQALHVSGNILVGNGHVYTGANVEFDLGSPTNQWRAFYGGNVYATLATPTQPYITSLGNLATLNVDGTTTLSNIFVNPGSTISAGNNRITWVGTPSVGTDAATKAYVDGVTGGSTGNLITLGTPTDGNLISPGAYSGWTSSTYVTDAIDDLNEMMDNVRANTFVKSVTFTANTTAGGAGLLVQLTITPTGTATLYDINWGDGLYSNAASSTTPTHPYTTNAGSPYTVIVRAYGAGSGTGSEASLTRTAYIIIYTADPVMGFELYRTSTGGTALSVASSTMYVTEGETFYLRNTTTNTTTPGMSVAYVANFGDGVANTSIASDSANGGVSGSRLSYSYAYNKSSGTGTLPVILWITSHNTANPASIPRNTSVNLKVYDANIAAPAGLNTKVLTFTGSVGTNATLTAQATDNTGGTALAANASVSRTISTGTTLITTTGNVTSSYTYNANVGYLQAVVNGTVRGNINLAATTSATISGNLGLIALSDYWLLTSAGVATTFALSTYSPGYFYGYQANVVVQAGSVPFGINRLGMNSTNTGIVANIEFVKDDVTAAPTITSGNLAIKAPGTYRYISGIPYFNTGSPQLWLQDVTLSSWIGQTWNNTSNVVFVATSTNLEGTTGNVILANTHAYVHLSNSSSPMLSSGTPIAGTGNVSAYSIANLTVAINQASVRSVANIVMTATNVNGSGTAAVNTTRRIQVHTAAQSGISEIAIACNVSLGDGTFTDTAKRSSYFISSTAFNPSYVNSTNFYTANVYSESSDPGVAGTKEATIRIGTLKYDVTNYSNAFLPPGPDRSGDTGFQYFTFAFRRRGVSSFNLNIVAPSGVANCWIAAPGTTLDSTSQFDGWLRADLVYGGAGKPGSNTGAGGNGTDGVAVTSADRIVANTALSGNYRFTLGTESLTNATGNVGLVRIALATGQTVTTLGIV
jgi:hypothetical protein